MDIARSLPVSLFLHALLVAVALVIGGNGMLAKNDLVVTLMEEQEIQGQPSGPQSLVPSRMTKQAQPGTDRIASLPRLGEHPGKQAPPVQDMPIQTGPEEMAMPYSPGSGQAESSQHAAVSGNGEVFTTAKVTAASFPISKNTDKEADYGAEMTKIRTAIESNLIYPYIAIKKRMEGTVETEFTINQKGHPEKIRITGSSGFAVLDEAARNTLVKASPFPAVPGRIEIPITFMLKKKEGNR